MISLTAILEFIQTYWLRILIKLILVGLLISLHFMKKRVSEGFQAGSGLLPFDKMHVCPMLKVNIENNSSLFDDHTEAGAVHSAKHTSHLLELFQKSYDDHGCEEYLQTAPPPPPRIPIRRVFPDKKEEPEGEEEE
jgi:hypothetical protein